jgi:hypothetical protein
MKILANAIAISAICFFLTCAYETQAAAGSAYELTLIPPTETGSPTIFRLDVVTGQVSDVSGSPAVAMKDPQPIPPGIYRLYATQTSDNKTYWLYRLETLSGRTWFISNNTWSEVTPAP